MAAKTTIVDGIKKKMTNENENRPFFVILVLTERIIDYVLNDLKRNRQNKRVYDISKLE